MGGGAVKLSKALLVAFALLCPASAMAQAQGFPNKTIRLIVPFPPGGPNDIIARVVSQKMQDILKQTIVIDNRSGQGGVVGTDAVAKAPPDGYTIGIASAGALAISVSMEKVSYETL
jgi:tripartite-type tricarboxylate transporter receptor subunit TctC